MNQRVAGFLVAAILFTLAGLALLIASRVDQHLADAHERMATLQYDRAAESLEAAEASVAYLRWLPSVGDRTRREIEARRAALHYWQGRYESVLPAEAEPVATVDEGNVELQLVVANAAYRVGLSGAKERAATVQALNDAANGYLTVLKNDTWHEDAAHNYEFVVRLRDEVQKGRRPAAAQQQQGQELGESGAPAPATSMKGFEIYIPREGDEKSPEGGDAGKATPTQRKG